MVRNGIDYSGNVITSVREKMHEIKKKSIRELLEEDNSTFDYFTMVY